jgi:hypothetical protein
MEGTFARKIEFKDDVSFESGFGAKKSGSVVCLSDRKQVRFNDTNKSNVSTPSQKSSKCGNKSLSGSHKFTKEELR